MGRNGVLESGAMRMDGSSSGFSASTYIASARLLDDSTASAAIVLVMRGGTELFVVDPTWCGVWTETSSGRLCAASHSSSRYVSLRLLLLGLLSTSTVRSRRCSGSWSLSPYDEYGPRVSSRPCRRLDDLIPSSHRCDVQPTCRHDYCASLLLGWRSSELDMGS